MNKEQWLNLYLEHRDDFIKLYLMFAKDVTEQKEKIALNERDVQALGSYLQEVWDNAPDAGWIHELKGWRVLCDLCSEWMFGTVCE